MAEENLIVKLEIPDFVVEGAGETTLKSVLVKDSAGHTGWHKASLEGCNFEQSLQKMNALAYKQFPEGNWSADIEGDAFRIIFVNAKFSHVEED